MTAAPFYVTTPIYYVNALPHLGTFYSTVVADAFARYHRARHGQASTYFLTGLDEHGQKIERITKEKGVAIRAYCDGIADAFKATWQRMGISYDRFIRTTDADHEAAVVAMWKRLEARGDIYPAAYEGLYCVGCEDWKTDDDIVVENGEKLCPIHRKPVETVKEKNYFFRLSQYRDKLLAFYEANKDFIRPESRYNEVVSFVRGELRDLSVSRMTVKWGIPVPGDPTHTVYVWIDALTNYITALGGPDALETDERAKAMWAASHHLIAKDIVRFHAVYWPAMLMSAGLPPPKQIFCHGYLTVKGQKISKSIPATRVDPNAIADAMGVDPLRYFVLREYTFGGDGDFSYEALFQRYESDLGNDLGNLANRTISMARRSFPTGVLAPAPFATSALAATKELAAIADEAVRGADRDWAAFSPSRALEAVWTMVRAANAYIDKTAPWKLAKETDSEAKQAELREVLASCCEVIRLAALLVAPAMPQAAAELLRQIGRAGDGGTWPTAPTSGWPGGTLDEPKPVFPRIDPDRQKELIAQWMSAALPAPAAETNAPAAASSPAEIAYEDFAKLDLRAAKILTAERVPKADKVLKLTLDVGEPAPRTVVSGIALAYAPEALVGQTVILVANLKPAKVRGILSQGMILAGGGAEVLALATLDRPVPPGTKVS